MIWNGHARCTAARAARSCLFALTLLGTLSPQAADRPTPAALAAVIARFHQGDPLALAELRREAPATRDHLIATLESQVAAGSWLDVQQTLRAIGALGVIDERVLAALDAAMQPAGAEVRMQILRVIGDLVPRAADADWMTAWLQRNAVDPRLARHEQEWRRSLVELLGAHPELREPRRTQSLSELRRVHLRAEFGRARSLESWLQLAEDIDVDVAEIAAERLAELGPAARASLESLRDLLLWNGDILSVKDAGAVEDPARPALSRVRHGPSAARLAAAIAITRIAPSSDAAREAHAVILRHGRPDQQRDSLIALRGFSGSGEAIAGLVLPLLDSAQHPNQRGEALVTLSTLGPAAAEALPQIERIAASDDAELAAVARATLRAVRGR